MKIKKSRRTKYRYIYVKSYLSSYKLENYLRILASYRFDYMTVSDMKISVIKVDVEYYIIKHAREYSLFIRTILNIIPQSTPIKTFHTVNKYKQINLYR